MGSREIPYDDYKWGGNTFLTNALVDEVNKLFPPKIAAPKPGDKVRVTLTGRVSDRGGDWEHTGMYTPAGALLPSPLFLDNRTIETLTIVQKAPTWKPGDVVVLRFSEYGSEFTYVRGLKDWPGDGARKSDAEVNALKNRGLVRHVLRDGKPV